ncbi:Zn(2)-C6 fungal-type domain-containing protein [Mycena venus]|uniref:Zn(2)-C6 fungal-type domain-containing protein n=1 Tax=Mycena venus TaxID=2733690 RepID=A0A8H6Z0Q7_9AGAR|nr:Zn(2)-C6 fungal-type domain-containing protein [Mycena venus]
MHARPAACCAIRSQVAYRVPDVLRKTPYVQLRLCLVGGRPINPSNLLPWGGPIKLPPALALQPGPIFGTSTDCPEITAEFVSHCFEGLKFNPQYEHPLIAATSIRSDIRAVSFQLHLLLPQSRVLALCSVAYASLSSFHPSVLGGGPRPESFLDHHFFSSSSELLGCGVRRTRAYRALRSEALKAAWDVGVILLPSNENAASCYLLDLMEQSDFGSAGRPWANAYLAHARALAPIWRASSFTATDVSEWAGFLMGGGPHFCQEQDSIGCDQLLLSGPEPPSLETLLASLEHSANDSSLSFLWASRQPFWPASYLTQLPETLHGSTPLSEVAVLNFLDAISKLHSILSFLLDRIDMVTTAPGAQPPPALDDASVDAVARAAATARQATAPSRASARGERMVTLRAQAHDMAVIGGKVLAKGIRYLPKIHYSPGHWATTRMWAEFVVEEADMALDVSPEAARDLETFADELKLLGYSLDAASTPQTLTLIERLEAHVNKAIMSMFLPIDDGSWRPLQDGVGMIL